jgi:hypothetical protein
MTPEKAAELEEKSRKFDEAEEARKSAGRRVRVVATG